MNAGMLSSIVVVLLVWVVLSVPAALTLGMAIGAVQGPDDEFERISATKGRADIWHNAA
jgi:hypothetical protein